LFIIPPNKKQEQIMGLLDKTYAFTRADETKAAGLYPFFRPIASRIESEVRMNGKRVIMLGSNSYLGLTHHPKVIEAGIAALNKYGSGCAGSPYLNGTLDIHLELAQKLAEFVGKEAALLFSTGFFANQGAISTITDRSDYIAYDAMDHASIIEGIRISFARKLKYAHNDMEQLEHVLASVDKEAGKLIVTDGVFSMEGDICKLPRIVELAKKYNAEVMVDEAHAIGVLGDNGKGTCEKFGLGDDVEIIMGTFSKSLASVGGFVAASERTINYIKHHSRELIFSASMPPASVATVLAALQVMKDEPQLREHLWANTRYMAKGLKDIGYRLLCEETPILPVPLGEDEDAFRATMSLQEEGVFVNPVISPAVPPGGALMRINMMATHTTEQMDFALGKMKKVGKKLGII
jgi:8-amino-7-oxononanoate synthase